MEVDLRENPLLPSVIERLRRDFLKEKEGGSHGA
jgi:hypothetical protein